MLAFDVLTREQFRTWQTPEGARALEFESSELTEPLAPGGTINPSWGALTHYGDWIDIWLSVRISGVWCPFRVASWAQENTRSFRRTTYGKQPGPFGQMAVDTYENTSGQPVEAWRVRVDLHGGAQLDWVGVQLADPQRFQGVSEMLSPDPFCWNVPMRSQYEFPEGKDYCASYSAWGVLQALGVEVSVIDVIAGVRDEAYDGGVWPFVAAEMSARLRRMGKQAFVRRFSSLQDIERCLRAGELIIVSINWDNDSADPTMHLRGGIPGTEGHMFPLIGMAPGLVIAADPATTKEKNHTDVIRPYDSRQLEQRWKNAGGVAIVVADSPF